MFTAHSPWLLPTAGRKGALGQAEVSRTWPGIILGTKGAVEDKRIVWVSPAPRTADFTGKSSDFISFRYEEKPAGKLKHCRGLLGHHRHCNLKALKEKISKYWKLHK